MYFVGGKYSINRYENYMDEVFEEVQVYSLEEVLKTNFMDGVVPYYEGDIKFDKDFNVLSNEEKANIIIEYIKEKALYNLFAFKTLEEAENKVKELNELKDYCEKTYEFSHLKESGHGIVFRVHTLNLEEANIYHLNKEDEKTYHEFLKNLSRLDGINVSDGEFERYLIEKISGNISVSLRAVKDNGKIKFTLLVQKNISQDDEIEWVDDERFDFIPVSEVFDSKKITLNDFYILENKVLEKLNQLVA